MWINKSYELTVDKVGCWILTNHYVSKVGTPAQKDIGYYPTPQQALKGCLEHSIIQQDLKDVKKLCDHLDKLYKDIDDNVIWEINNMNIMEEE